MWIEVWMLRHDKGAWWGTGTTLSLRVALPTDCHDCGLVWSHLARSFHTGHLSIREINTLCRRVWPHKTKSGFHSDHSTQDVMLRVTEECKLALGDNINDVSILFIDFSKALDLIDYPATCQTVYMCVHYLLVSLKAVCYFRPHIFWLCYCDVWGASRLSFGCPTIHHSHVWIIYQQL